MMCSHTRGANYSSCELRPCDAADADAALTWFSGLKMYR